ncbi:MAG: hypothetical protein E6J13_12305 [Chloroflexi bacterium]|nr:MAG: hypothetical protein E6J13_12305 [Chloroflexota bacterium]
MTRDLAFDVATAPPGALTLISSRINRRPKRLLGVLKVENEYVGYVRETGFEIWERRQSAVHAIGTVAGRRGGSHIEVRFVLPLRTRVLILLFFALYAAVVGGLALRSSDDVITTEELIAAGTGACVLIVIFALAAVRQRADLRGLIERIFAEIPRV